MTDTKLLHLTIEARYSSDLFVFLNIKIFYLQLLIQEKEKIQKTQKFKI